ncbi:MAG: hypothetical protein RIQ41_223 [Candidatus Parcubacteria bacterium]|jgi:hypothetical protein
MESLNLFANNRGMIYACSDLVDVEDRVSKLLAGNAHSGMQAIVVIKLSDESWHVMPAFKPLDDSQRLRKQHMRELYEKLREVYPEISVEIRLVKICGHRFAVANVRNYADFITDVSTLHI